MDLRPTSEQSQLVDAVGALYTRHASTDHVRAAEPVGFDAALWSRVLDLGAVTMAVPEAAGGWGASLLDLALMAEQQGRHLAPVPVIEAQVAARLLARLDTRQADAARAGVIAGHQLVTLALHPARGGTATLVPAAAVADQAMILDGRRLVLVHLDGARTPVENLGSMPLADVVIGSNAVELVAGDRAVAAYAEALDEWMVLTGAALVGLAARALEIGVAYVKQRHAWGVPIGSFQSIAHRLADDATAVDGARLLAHEAAWAACDDPIRAPELAAMSFAFAAETARRVSYDSLHFHGGYGFMMEYDIQLFYRRARAWAHVFAEPGHGYRLVADRRHARLEA